jgi:hypothetical protein
MAEKGEPLVAYAVTTASTRLESAKLHSHLSAQAAELFALTRAGILAKGQSATIYTDSRYAFGVVHDSVETELLPDLFLWSDILSFKTC